MPAARSRTRDPVVIPVCRLEVGDRLLRILRVGPFVESRSVVETGPAEGLSNSHDRWGRRWTWDHSIDARSGETLEPGRMRNAQWARTRRSVPRRAPIAAGPGDQIASKGDPLAAQAGAKVSSPTGPRRRRDGVGATCSTPTAGLAPPIARPATLAQFGHQRRVDWTSRHGAIGPGNRLAARFSVRLRKLPAFPPGAIFGNTGSVGRDTLVGPHVSISAGMVPGQKMVTDPVSGSATGA